MGKGARKRLDRQVQAQQQAQTAAAQKKAADRKRILWIAVAIVAVVAIGLTLFFTLFNRGNKGDGTFRDKIVMTSEHFQVDGAMMSFFIHSEVGLYVKNNASTLSLVGLDTESDLKSQPCSEAGAETWYDYFANLAIQRVSYYLYLAEGATEAGITLDDDDKEYLDNQMQLVRDQAAQAKQEVELFVEENFGKGVTLDDIYRAIEIRRLGDKLRPHVESGVSYTDEELSTYYADNATKLNTCDYYAFTFDNTVVGGEDKAEELAECHDEAAFRAYLEEYYRRNYEDIGQSYNEAEIKAAFDTNVKVVEGYIYEETDLSDWALDPERQVGDTHVFEEEYGYTVYFITKAPARLDYKTCNYRQIVLTDTTDTIEVNRRTKINQIRDEYLAGEQTEAAFAALAERYNESKDSRASGGLCSDMRREDVGEKACDWLFDDSRKAGDIRIIKEDGDSYYLIYYIGEGEVCWKVTADAQIKEAAFNRTVNQLFEKTNISVDRAAIADLPG